MFSRRIVMGGPPRSGSTVLRSLLNGHERIVAPPETTAFIRPFHEFKRRAARFAERTERRLGLPKDETERAIDGAKDSVSFFDGLMARYLGLIERRGVDAWVEKTPRNCMRYAELSRQHPDLLFVSLVRDGRDVVTSVVPESGRPYYCSLERYAESVRAVLDFDGGSNADRHLLVRYEELVQDPPEVLRSLLGFIGLGWSEAMLSSYRKRSGASRGVKESGPIGPQWIGRWREAEHRARMKEFYAHEDAMWALAQTGYDP